MVYKLFSNLKNKDKGVTLVELVVVIFLIAIFSTILIADFPRIQRQFALSRVSYKLAQDLRRTQDLGLSGVKTLDKNKNQIAVKGYGIYIDTATQPIKKYIIYADIDVDNTKKDTQKYSGDSNFPLCNAEVDIKSDCVIDVIDVSKENSNLYIKKVKNLTTSATNVSINFTPPNPTINIDGLDTINNQPPDNSRVGIVLGLTSDGSERTVWINTSGLINVQ